ncbi:MAG: tetraacyldisaccharide 4'-kinase [Moraxellaceae bacterium]|nr:tetraacyldisaccharide 4'-kinase [Moraxellaceae bacterium]
MSLETYISHAWQTQAKWLYLLLPLAWLHRLIITIRQLLYRIGLLKSYRANVPVMVIGNITVGGSGKTPLIITLVNYLQSKGVKVGVISRGYGGDTSHMPALVTLDSLPYQVGDEPYLIVQSTIHNKQIIPMAVCPNRQQAIELLLKSHVDIQLIISDDGLQHYQLQRDIEWIVVDKERGFGNQQLLPVGFLREPISRLDGATVIYHQLSNDNQSAENQLIMNLQADKLQSFLNLSQKSSTTESDDLKKLLEKNSKLLSRERKITQFPQKNDTVYAVSGIGYPQRFFTTLKNLGYQVLENPYPDHYNFQISDIIKISENSKNLPVIITSKDMVKINYLLKEKYAQSIAGLDDFIKRLFILPVTAQLSEACYQSLDNELEKFFSVHEYFLKRQNKSVKIKS